MTEEECEDVGYFAPRTGWLPDFPDFRDYSFDNKELLERKEVHDLVVPTGLQKLDFGILQTSVNLRRWCSPIEDQGNLGSCTANAGAGIVEYYENRAFHKYLDASRLFLYKVSRRLAHLSGDSGAYIRSTMGALVLFGIPPEDHWPYTDRVPDFDREPDCFCYAFAENYKSIKYFRHDTAGMNGQSILDRVKLSLMGGVPSMFGFTVYSSISQAQTTGKIPFPCSTDARRGGHAVVAVGFDDRVLVENSNSEVKTEGALLIRNSWGKDWGESGYGWLPYEYVLRGLAVDFWSILKQKWVDTGLFRV